ncbi:glycosyl hydrolase [Bacteroidota bacterium]
MITEYASEEWYDLVAYAFKKAKKLDLDIWLYDENSFPSGFAGGLVPAQMPESYNDGHALRFEHQDVLRLDPEKEYLMVYLYADSAIDISDRIEAFSGKRGDFYLYEKVYFPVREWYAGFSYVDLLKPGVTEKFIEVTMPGYEERLGDNFGRGVPGIFTDEPNIAPQGEGILIRWTLDLFARFYERWNYRLEPHLRDLVQNTSLSGKVRHNYYQLLLELFIDRWSRPWFEYSEAHNLKWTGHYWEHGWPSPHHGPDHMAMYAWHQVPGIDMLFNTQTERPDQFGNIRAVRELNSVGNQLGRIRKLSETYGGSGWELSFEDMKRHGDWEYVLGVNLMNQHLSYQSLKGDRKHDFPQSFSYHVPFWEEYNVLNSYFGRLSLALSSGEQHNKTLVLEPTTTAWMHYSPDQANTDLETIYQSFNELLQLLESEHIEYDLGSENIIRDHGSVEPETFVVGKRNYNYLVIPQDLSNINSETASLIETYLEQGGIILALCQPPSYIDGMMDPSTIEWKNNYPDQWYEIGGCNDPRLIQYLKTNEFIVTEREGGEMYHMRRQMEDGQLLFIVNYHASEKGNIRLNMMGEDIVEIDLFSGAVMNYPFVMTNSILSFDTELEPGESRLYFISETSIRKKERGLQKWRNSVQEIQLYDIEVEGFNENVLTLDYCSLILGGDTLKEDYFYDQQTRIFNEHGFEKNPWVSASQYKTRIADRDTFGPGSGFTARYRFFIDTAFASGFMKLVVERPELYQVRLNGTIIQPEDEEWWMDKDFGVFDISEYIHNGENIAEIEASPFSVHCELEPLYLFGNFNVKAAERGWTVEAESQRKIGSWKAQGMPFYSGAMDYRTSFDLNSKTPVKLIMNEWEGTVASVLVNGMDAGHIFTKPYELRIDKYVHPGRNTIRVRIYGSLKNVLGPHHNVERQGIVTPWSFKYAPDIQPAGEDYDLLDYGLMKPFKVLVMK